MPVVVPSLDELARDPARAAALPAHTLRALILTTASLQNALAAALIAEENKSASAAPPQAAAATAGDEMLTINEAAALLRRSRRWLYRNADRLPFVKRVSRKSLLCSKSRLLQWLAIQPARRYISVHANKARGFVDDGQNHHPFA